ncbi:MAG: sorbosone dehydrogenase family protein [Verrucomicrobia bacterium]|nr:sorbosone dehydrogenase family protein [Verrucomicrobiota bacterium]
MLVALDLLLSFTAAHPTDVDPANENAKLLTGKAAMGDWTTDTPGVQRRITVEDLPSPYQTKSFDNAPAIVPRPPDAKLHVPPGFQVLEFARGFSQPRFLLTAPNGDVFVTDSSRNEVVALRESPDHTGVATRQVFVSGLRQPFGLAFYPPGPNPQYLYVANTDSVIRVPYRDGDLRARGPAESIGVDLSPGGLLRGGGHWTRAVVFSNDGRKMFVSIGSRSNVDEGDEPGENQRARIFEFNSDGTDRQVYAWGIRNAVGIAVHPLSGTLWMSTNERDGLGDNLPPDYISSVRAGGFYGWPWFYIGSHQDPRHAGQHPELAARVIIPDVLVQAHSATLNLVFYTGHQFPAEYRNNLFAAFHGSWNRSRRTGYKIVRVPMDQNGHSRNGVYEDFLTGFVTPAGNVWGRPVGLTVAKDGALLMSEDAGNTIWRISYTGS